MRGLFDPSVLDETRRRVLELRPDSERRWGTMQVGQTLAHCTAGIEMAMGAIRPKPASLPMRWFGKVIKPLVVRGDQPMRRNSPSIPELFSGDPTNLDFTTERARLIDAIENFASQGPAGCSQYPHPLFGPLTPEEWAVLMHKPLDHHLRQFGV